MPGSHVLWSRGTLARGTLARGTLARGTLALGTLARGTLARGTLARGTLARGTLALGFLLLSLSSCTCQRAENIEAKQWLKRPAPPDPRVKAAEENIDVDNLTDPKVLRRVIDMDGTEIAARLRSFRFDSTGDLAFSRGASSGALKSAETTRVLQGRPRVGGDQASGDFAVEVKTGDGSEMQLAYVNEIFFLKNNNGKWRMSRDPQGERNAYRSDAVAVWRGFYDLVKHGLVVEKLGSASHDGRSVIKYRMALPDTSAEARALGAGKAAPPVGPDGGPADEPAADKAKRISDRMASWRSSSRPAGGEGELWVDQETAVALVVKMNGKMVVGDGPDASVLTVAIDARYSQVGQDHQVPMPKDAIEEVVRKKMPVRPRALLEDEGLVSPLPRDAGPQGGSTAPKKGELPDEDDEG